MSTYPDEFKQLQEQIERLEDENEMLREVVKNQIEVADVLEEVIKTMNEVGKKFGIKPFILTPRPTVPEFALKGGAE